MCGIVGIISNEQGPSTSLECIGGCVALENRGRNSAGLITYNSKTKEFELERKDIGPSQQVFNKDFLDLVVPGLKGNIAIGHDRYETFGADPKKDLQPFHTNHPGIAMAENGQIINCHEIKEKLRTKDWRFSSDCDVEFILYSLAQNLLDRNDVSVSNIPEYLEKKLYPSLEDIMKEGGRYYLEGGYSVVAIIDGKGLLAFKDPHGIRPLAFGKKTVNNQQFINFSSEITAHEFLGGYTDLHELKHGEAVFVDFDMNVYRKIIHQEKESPCGFEWPYFGEEDSVLWGVNNYDAKVAFGRNIASEIRESHPELLSKIDYVTGIPRTGVPTALEISRELGVDFREVFKKRLNIRSFLYATQKERIRAIMQKMIPIESQIKGRSGLFVEDSTVRGNTGRMIAKILYSLGARELYAYFNFGPIKHICPYGIDMSDPDELIANIHGGDHRKIADDLGVKAVYFQSHEHFLEGIGRNKDNTCLGCLTGEYPTDKKRIEEYSCLRKRQREERIVS